MAEITAEGYSFNNRISVYTFVANQTPSLSDALELGYSTDRFSDSVLSNALELGYTNSEEISFDEIFVIWQNPVFISPYCPAAGPARPTTGQVYPRGYS